MLPKFEVSISFNFLFFGGKLFLSLSHCVFLSLLSSGAIMCLVTQSCSTLCSPMDWGLLGSSVHGTFQARIQEVVAISYSRVFFLQGSNPYLRLLHRQADSLPQVPPEESLSACWPSLLIPFYFSLVLQIAKPKTGTWLFGRWFRIENISSYPVASLFTHYLSVWARVLSSTWFLGPVIQSFP